jgi:hypothetical protein
VLLAGVPGRGGGVMPIADNVVRTASIRDSRSVWGNIIVRTYSGVRGFGWEEEERDRSSKKTAGDDASVVSSSMLYYQYLRWYDKTDVLASLNRSVTTSPTVSFEHGYFSSKAFNFQISNSPRVLFIIPYWNSTCKQNLNNHHIPLEMIMMGIFFSALLEFVIPREIGALQ